MDSKILEALLKEKQQKVVKKAAQSPAALLTPDAIKQALVVSDVPPSDGHALSVHSPMWAAAQTQNYILYGSDHSSAEKAIGLCPQVGKRVLDSAADFTTEAHKSLMAQITTLETAFNRFLSLAALCGDPEIAIDTPASPSERKTSAANAGWHSRRLNRPNEPHSSNRQQRSGIRSTSSNLNSNHPYPWRQHIMPRWTPEARQKQSELIRTWQPWSQSTGPRSEAGKAKAAQNSLKHGWHSQPMVELRAQIRQLNADRAAIFAQLLNRG